MGLKIGATRHIISNCLSAACIITVAAAVSYCISPQKLLAESGDSITSGLVFQWKANQSSGSSVTDSSSNSNDGTLTNMDTSTAWSTDTPNTNDGNTHSLLFNNTDTNDYVISGSVLDSSVTGSNSRTLCGWIKLNTASGIQIAFNYGSQVVGQKFGIFTDGSHWNFWGYGSSDFATTAAPDTNWHNHCVTYNGTTVTYYLDGSSIGSTTRALNTGTTTFLIGQRDSSDLSQPLRGRVDDLRLYSRVLSPTEIQVIANVPDTTIDSSPASLTNDTTGTFEFSSSASPSTFQCKLDSGSYSGCTSPFTTSSLSDGSHTFYVKSLNANSQADPSPASYDWIIDTDPPETNITDLGDVTVDSPAQFVLTSNETVTFECNLDSSTYSACDTSYTTPSLSDGEHTLLVRATDTAGNVDLTPASFTWTLDRSGVDTDSDGILDTEENTGPNDGDANGDSIPDATQPNVMSFINPDTHKTEVIETNCDSLSHVQVGSESTEEPDISFRYPFGLTYFWAQCSDPGMTANFSQYYYEPDNDQGYLLRKWSSGSPYATVPGATFQNVTIGGQAVLKLSYQVTDGGEFDEDGTADARIIDPAGPAIFDPIADNVGAPNTGHARVDSRLPILAYLTALGLAIWLGGSLKKRLANK